MRSVELILVCADTYGLMARRVSALDVPALTSSVRSGKNCLHLTAEATHDSPRGDVMTQCFRRRRFGAMAIVVVVLLAVGTVGTSQAQESKSAPLAQQLAERMGQGQLQSVAAGDSAGEGRFVAALYFPGQLLVVSAEYEAPIYVEQKLTAQQYRDVYIDLNSASIPESKIFITDSNADGLQAKQGQDAAPDSFDGGGRQLRLDGNWGGQGMSEADYMQAFEDADSQYSRMLQDLLNEIR